MEPGDATEEKAMSAAQKRAEIRRRKLLLNSEERMNRIVGCTKNGSENGKTSLLLFYTHLSIGAVRITNDKYI